MTYLADLSPCTYLDRSGASRLVSVGWLSRTHVFTSGPVDADVRSQLETLLVDPYCPVTFMGAHQCEFCTPAIAHPHDHHYPHGSSNLLVPGDGVIFACPELIGHYIDEHLYQPPSVFLAAVAACPPVDSEHYFLRLLQIGGTDWAETLRAEVRLFGDERVNRLESKWGEEWAEASRRRTQCMVGALRALGFA